MIEGRITKVGNSWAVVLPKRLRSQLGWWPGDTVNMAVNDAGLLMQNTTQRDVKLVSRNKPDDARNPNRV